MSNWISKGVAEYRGLNCSIKYNPDTGKYYAEAPGLGNNWHETGRFQEINPEIYPETIAEAEAWENDDPEERAYIGYRPRRPNPYRVAA